jgi:hypothetical protein
MDTLKTSNCDASFKKSPRINEYRCSVLRKGKKGDRPAPKYLYAVPSSYEGRNLQSLAHANYLFDNFGIKIDLKNPIGNGELEIQEYNTSKKIEPFCSACERGLRLDFKFCPYCGKNQREGQ